LEENQNLTFWAIICLEDYVDDSESEEWSENEISMSLKRQEKKKAGRPKTD